MRLSNRDYDALLRAILELNAHRDVEEFWQAVPRIFLNLMSAEPFGLVGGRIDPVAKRATVVDVHESGPVVTPEIRPTLGRFLLDYPCTGYFMRTVDTTALKFSDFLSDSHLRENPMYRELYHRLGWDRLLSVAVTNRKSDMAAINLLRKDRDFSERDRLLLNLIQPHFELGCRNAERATSRQSSNARPLEDYSLSPREAETARWLAEGKTNPEIAIILGASVRTIEKHVGRVIEKLGVENRTSAALMLARCAF